MPYQPTDPAKEPPPPKVLKSGNDVVPEAVLEEIDRVCDILESLNRSKLAKMFENCYPNTLATTTSLLDDNSTYIITGDIDLMWLRDSSAQVHQYLPLAKDAEVQRIIEGNSMRFANELTHMFRSDQATVLFHPSIAIWCFF